MTCDPEGH